jgi:hypothetical protein
MVYKKLHIYNIFKRKSPGPSNNSAMATTHTHAKNGAELLHTTQKLPQGISVTQIIVLKV